ncbi:MAG TPA: prepilin-type N-terminal cleavage/methylation domain-containing protein [Armatimonadota bacterium]|jgi:prepilin-type N-terminal cleavage/methylation domain-containing protein
MRNTAKKAQKGFTLIELLIVIAVIAILAAIAIPNLLSSRKAANESSAIASLRTIVSAEETYRSRDASHSYADLAALGTAKLLDETLGKDPFTKSGYKFAGAADPNTYSFTADPETDGSSGDRGFFVDQTGVIRVSPAKGATVASPPIQ